VPPATLLVPPVRIAELPAPLAPPEAVGVSPVPPLFLVAPPEPPEVQVAWEAPPAAWTPEPPVSPSSPELGVPPELCPSLLPPHDTVAVIPTNAAVFQKCAIWTSMVLPRTVTQTAYQPREPCLALICRCPGTVCVTQSVPRSARAPRGAPEVPKLSLCSYR
jgi:hypothetical protein